MVFHNGAYHILMTGRQYEDVPVGLVDDKLHKTQIEGDFNASVSKIHTYYCPCRLWEALTPFTETEREGPYCPGQ